LQHFKGADGVDYTFNPMTGTTQPMGIGAGKDAPITKTVANPDGSQSLVQWNPETEQWDAAKIPEGGTTAMPKAKLTESQAKTTLYQSLQAETTPVLNKIEEQWNPANISDAAARSVPIAGNFFQSPEGQMYTAAASAWTEGALRISSGAAVTPEEFERIKSTYFAVPGDLPATVAFKSQMRAMYERAIQKALGDKNGGSETLPMPNEFARTFSSAGSPDNMSPDELKYLGIE
jgi:hypothetical protein